MSFRSLIERQQAFRDIQPTLADDHSRQSSAENITRVALSGSDKMVMVLDLGCGDGDSQDFFNSICDSVQWFGVDIEGSAEVASRTRRDGNFTTFDGINLPFRDAGFDMVFCRQVLEHVRYPDRLLEEVARVLKPGGKFIGSVSYLEPYHSRSIFNFTPYGIIRVFNEAGLEVRELRPGASGGSLIFRQMVMGAKSLDFLLRHSLFYLSTSIFGRILRTGNQHINFIKLQFAGHIVFVGQKPGSE